MSRPVKFATKLASITRKKTNVVLLLIIIPFLLISLSMIIPIFLISSSSQKEIPKVNYEKIRDNGMQVSGTITGIETDYNMNINNQNPSIISYKYIHEDKQVTAKVRTLAFDKVKKMKVGDSAEVKHLNQGSIIDGLKPYYFPYELFYYLSIPLLLIGLFMLLYLLRITKKEINLYKYGEVREATIKAIMPISGLPVTNIGRAINVHYQYLTSSGKKFFGEYKTTDFSILNEKEQGDTIKIFVSPKDESKSCLIPQIEVLRNGWEIE